MANIAYIGTGLLGSALAEAALGRGDRVTVWNRSENKARALEAFGAVVAATAADAARGAERVHLVLRDDAVVEEIIRNIRPALGPDTVLLDHSTTLPHLTAQRVERLASEGIRYLHCPTFAGPAAARQSQGIMLVSGPQAVYEQAKDALEKQTGKLVYLGERPDLAAAYKLIGNTLIISLGSLISDLFTIAAANEVSPADALRLLEFFNPTTMLQNRGRRMARADFEASFALSMARKDVQLILDSVGERPMALMPAIAARMDQVIAEGLGDRDYGVIAHDALGL